MSDKSDQLVKNLIAKAEAKSKEIKKIQNYNLQTNLVFPWGDGSSVNNSTNLNTIRTPDKFVEILAFLLEKYCFFTAAQKELGLPTKFKWGGFSKDQWVHDIKHRVDMIRLSEKKKDLASIRSQLDDLMSPEMKREREIAKLQEKLNQ